MPVSWFVGGGIFAIAGVGFNVYMDTQYGRRGRDSGALYILSQWAAFLVAYYVACCYNCSSFGVWHYAALYASASVIASVCFFGVDWNNEDTHEEIVMHSVYKERVGGS
jgi:hypothetical protein